MKSDQLRLMTLELSEMVNKMPKRDWTQRESARADLRRKVRRLLAEYGDPSDLSEDATALVLKQAELSTENGASQAHLNKSPGMVRYVRPERICQHNSGEYTEKWAQEQIAANPKMLNLGNIIFKGKERMQPRAGRLRPGRRRAAAGGDVGGDVADPALAGNQMTQMMFGACLAVSIAATIVGCRGTTQRAATERLPTGRAIAATMPAARQAVGHLPMNLAMSADRRFAVVSDMGQRQSLTVLRASDGRLVSSVEFPKTPSQRRNGLYYGLVLADDGTLYVAQGGNASVAILKLDDAGALTRGDTIAAQPGDFPAGLALDGRGFLYATSNAPQPTELRLDTKGAVVAYDAAARREVGRLTLGRDAPGLTYPLSVVATRAGKLYVASQRDGCVYVVDAGDPAAMRLVNTIAVGANPCALAVSSDQATLFVANANSDTISIVDTAGDRVRQTILLRPSAASKLAGASPVGLALAPDGKTLYAALGDMNAVAVIDVARGELLGYVPSGWYPSALGTDGGKLLVVNAKGSSAMNPNPPVGTMKRLSPTDVLQGDVVTIDVPERGRSLEAATREVLERARLTPRYLSRENPLAKVGVEHVIYIIKENRSYDQVLGDLPQGNGDSSRCIFGRDVTPNQHALAERFVLLDNFYASGEVTGDGWKWSTQAMANEYVIKNIPYYSSGRGRTFDFGGENNGYPTGGFPATGAHGERLSEHPAFRDGGPPIRDVTEAAGGYLWDICTRNGVSFRNYGFMIATGLTKDGVVILPDNYPAVKGLQPGGHDLAGLTNVDYRRHDLAVADSDAPEIWFKRTGNPDHLRIARAFGKYQSPSRFSEWNREFQMMLAKDPTGGAVPKMMFVSLPNDHTDGMRGGMASPRSMVADNDYAVGQLVEAVSKSPIWRKTAIFIIEDDAQDGPDHVDAHRTTCYIVSPWIKRASVDHTFHNTVSCIRTMELLLGLPPMNQYDAAADPILNWTAAPENSEPFEAILPAAEIIGERNPTLTTSRATTAASRPATQPNAALAALIRESEAMNFTHPDQAPADRLNEIIWQSVRGVGVPMPPTPHGPAVLAGPAHDADDDD